jgi:hypothetical protein
MASQEFLKESLFEEIDLIQNIIKRMASNSFLIKGWTITLVVATLLLKGSKYQVFISFIPLLSFWFLDAYFLRQERMYIKLYEWVIANRLKSEEYLFNLNGYRFEKEVKSICQTMFCITLGWFYGILLLLIIGYSVLLFML